MTHPHHLSPSIPEIITSGYIEVFSFYDKMDPQLAVDELERGVYVLVEDFYYNGLQILKQLKTSLSKKYTSNSFQDQRAYRGAYKKLSHYLLLMVYQHKLEVKKSPKIGWFAEFYSDEDEFLISFPDVQGLNSSWQWYINGIKIEVLNAKIYPFYGVYFPTRFEHLELLNTWLKTYQGNKESAIDVGTGSGILAFMLLKHGFNSVIGTDTNPNAIISCWKESKRMGYTDKFELSYGDLFAGNHDKFELIIFNPPWLKARHELEEGIDKSIYYQSDLFPRFFEKSKHHLSENGKLVILFSNLSSVINDVNEHPIRQELDVSNRYAKETYQKLAVKPGSTRTKRKNWRSNEIVELWVLRHR